MTPEAEPAGLFEALEAYAAEHGEHGGLALTAAEKFLVQNVLLMAGHLRELYDAGEPGFVFIWVQSPREYADALIRKVVSERTFDPWIRY